MPGVLDPPRPAPWARTPHPAAAQSVAPTALLAPEGAGGRGPAVGNPCHSLVPSVTSRAHSPSSLSRSSGQDGGNWGQVGGRGRQTGRGGRNPGEERLSPSPWAGPSCSHSGGQAPRAAATPCHMCALHMRHGVHARNLGCAYLGAEHPPAFQDQRAGGPVALAQAAGPAQLCQAGRFVHLHCPPSASALTARREQMCVVCVCVCCPRAHTCTPAFPEPSFLGTGGTEGSDTVPPHPSPSPLEVSAWGIVLCLPFPKPSPEIDCGLLKVTEGGTGPEPALCLPSCPRSCRGRAGPELPPSWEPLHPPLHSPGSRGTWGCDSGSFWKREPSLGS